MLDLLWNVGLVAVVLGLSWLLTNLYVRVAYYRCSGCGSLNAKRRSRCRICGEALTAAPGEAQR